LSAAAAAIQFWRSLRRRALRASRRPPRGLVASPWCGCCVRGPSRIPGALAMAWSTRGLGVLSRFLDNPAFCYVNSGFHMPSSLDFGMRAARFDFGSAPNFCLRFCHHKDVFRLSSTSTHIWRLAGLVALLRLTGFGHRNRDRLLAAFHLAAGTALEFALLVFAPPVIRKKSGIAPLRGTRGCQLERPYPILVDPVSVRAIRPVRL
jgi:hypothetical protein